VFEDELGVRGIDLIPVFALPAPASAAVRATLDFDVFKRVKQWHHVFNRHYLSALERIELAEVLLPLGGGRFVVD
jgi:hypothetical protein